MLPKAEQLLRTSVQPYISSILEALMEPTSRGFSEVRDVFSKELIEISKNLLNGDNKEKLGEVNKKKDQVFFVSSNNPVALISVGHWGQHSPYTSVIQT